jgi:hypothetical protein
MAMEVESLKVFKCRRVKDAVGAYCLDCQRVIADDCQTVWHWRKSQMLHERGTGHQTIMYKVV